MPVCTTCVAVRQARDAWSAADPSHAIIPAVPVSARHRAFLLLLPVAIRAVAACRDTPAAFGATAATARVNADDVTTALEERFTRVERPSALADALQRITRSPFAAAKLYDDSTLWTATLPDGERVLVVAGSYAGDHYLFTPRADAPPPDRLGDSRHEMRLARISSGIFEWNTSVANAIGPMTADDVARLLASLLAAGAREDEATLRADVATAFPRTLAALGRFLSLDSLEHTALEDGTAQVHIVVTMHPGQIKPLYPDYAGYLDRYITRVRGHATVLDPLGTPWIEAEIDHATYSLSLRATRDGHFAPLTGPPHAIPDSLLVHAAVSTRISLFNVGFTDLVAPLLLVEAPHERAWSLHFRQEPHWHFPLAVDHLIKSPLRRPFADAGAAFRIGVTDSTGRQTRLARETHLIVQESAIMRWIGGLAGNAIGAYSGPVQQEGDAVLAETFAALRDDLAR